MKKLKIFVASLVLVLTGCGVNGNCKTCTGEGGGSGEGGSGQIDLDAVNKYIHQSGDWFDLRSYGNKVTLIPFTHINGPRAEWEQFAIVNYEYDATTYYKYQLTYLSCTCRSADVNYWQTAYVELSVPTSGQADDVVLRYLSFDWDNPATEQEHHYLGGFWGDSGTQGAINTSDYDVTYDDIKNGFIPFLTGKTYGYMKTLSVAEDINKDQFKSEMNGVMFHGLDNKYNEQVTMDHFHGASVSTNNIIRAVTALMKYHAENNIG